MLRANCYPEVWGSLHYPYMGVYRLSFHLFLPIPPFLICLFWAFFLIVLLLLFETRSHDVALASLIFAR